MKIDCASLLEDVELKILIEILLIVIFSFYHLFLEVLLVFKLFLSFFLVTDHAILHCQKISLANVLNLNSAQVHFSYSLSRTLLVLEDTITIL